MLGKLHFMFDVPILKCCFSSIMKPKAILMLGASLVAILFSSCATDPGGVDFAPGSPLTAGLRSGDQAITRNSIDAILNNPAPRERPGLATGWGDEKKSQMTYTQFVRASSKPAGTDIIYYNDPDGIDAMTNYKYKIGAMQTAAGEMVEWGVKGRIGFLPAYKSSGRRFVAGSKDSTYSIVVKNRSKSALEIVASVDGLDVQDGKTASFSKRGYIIGAGETLEIEGFRTSNNKVAAFKFSSVSNSYANLRHGDTRNVGVIGLAVFTQKGVNPWTWMASEVQRRGSANPFAVAP
jgi:hypothetical protein